MSTQLDTDYLVVGAGAMALAFVDTILDETDASVVIVDRYDKPGGHWRVGYDFVRLHQPSDYYGVNSRPLGSGAVERVGYNAGLLELAALDEIRDYFEKVMNETFLPTGRVRYFPNSDYVGNGQVARILSGDEFRVVPRRATVDGTFMKVAVPAVTPSPFTVRDDVRMVPPNGLARLSHRFDQYVVVGGGKTAIDTVLWMLDRGACPEQVSWVIPRDSWLFNREICQPGPQFIAMSDKYASAFSDAWLQSSSMDELYDKLVESEYIFRLSDEVRPTRNRCATVTRAELAAIRTITDVVRLGRVEEVNSAGLILELGTREFDGDVLYVDCTANGLARIDPVPVFRPGLITLESIAFCNQVFGASFIAHIEARFDDDTTKNSLTTPVLHPSDESDFIRSSLIEFSNALLWSEDPEIVEWQQRARLAGLLTRVGTPLPPPGPEREKALAANRGGLVALIAKAEELLSDIEARSEPVEAGA